MHEELIHTKLKKWFGNTDVSQILAYTLDLLYEANVPIYSDEDATFPDDLQVGMKSEPSIGEWEK